MGEAQLVDLGSTRGRLLVPVLVGVALLISMISSLGAPLIPTIAASYDVAVGTAQWSLTITLLVGAVSTPLTSRLGDGPRRRAVIVGALAACGVGCVLAAVPASFACFLAGRALQGVAVGLIPVGMSVIRDHLPQERRRRAVITLSVSAAAGVGLGYPVTGLVADQFGFRAGYWLTAGLSVLAVLLAVLVVPASGHRAPVTLGAVGSVLLVSGLLLVLLALSQSNAWGWGSGRYLGTTACGAALLAVWTVHELRAVNPVVDLRIMRSPLMLAMNLTGLFAGLGMYLLLALIIRFVQTPVSVGYGFGSSVLVAGFILVPFSLASVASTSLVTALTRILADRWLIPIGCGAFVASLLMFRFWSSELWEMYVIMALAGLGVGASFAAMPRLIMRAVPAERTSGALGANQVLRFVGFTLGSALSATILDLFVGDGERFPSLTGYHVAALVGAMVWGATGLLAFVAVGHSADAPSAPTEQERLAMLESGDAAAAGTVVYEPGRLDEEADK